MKHGLRLVIGSWKIIAMSLPTSVARARASDSASRSRPAKRMRIGASRGPGKSIRPISASAVTLLPEPDSPTMPRTSPASTVEVDAVDGAERRRCACRIRRVRSLDLEQRHASRSSLQLRVERVAQAVAHQVEGEHRDQDREARETSPPTSARWMNSSALGQHRAPLRRRRLRAEAEEAERRGVEDRRRRSRASPARSAAPCSSAGWC